MVHTSRETEALCLLMNQYGMLLAERRRLPVNTGWTVPKRGYDWQAFCKEAGRPREEGSGGPDATAGPSSVSASLTQVRRMV